MAQSSRASQASMKPSIEIKQRPEESAILQRIRKFSQSDWDNCYDDA
jgi:hypothetical protein